MSWFRKTCPVAEVPTVSVQGQPLVVNVPSNSPERTLRCLCRMLRIYRTLIKHANKGDTYLDNFRQELARLEASLIAAGDTGKFNQELVEKRILDLGGTV